METDTQGERALVRAMEGDRGALTELLERAGPRVRERIAPKISGWLAAHLDADDVMQVTYLEVVLRLDRFERGGFSGFVAWMSRLAENNLIDAVRSLQASKRPDPKRQVGVSAGDDSYLGLVEMLGATYTTPSRDAARHEAQSFIERALKRMPKDYARVIRGYDLEGLGIEEIAQELGRSAGAVYMLRARAHDCLRDVLGSESQFFSTPA